MEDLLSIFKRLEILQEKLDEYDNDFMSKIRDMVHGASAACKTAIVNSEAKEQINCASTQQTKKHGRQMLVKIRREKFNVVAPSSDENEATATCKTKVVAPPKIVVTNVLPVNKEASIHSNITDDTISSTNTPTIAQTNKKSKKKKPHQPIKVELFSDFLANSSPISSRTRQGSVGRNQRQGSIYKDAVEELPGAVKPTKKVSDSTKNAATPPNHSNPKDVASVTAAVNETINTTMNLGTNDATFQVDPVKSTFVVPNNSSNPNAKVTLSLCLFVKSGCDATFNVPEERQQANSGRLPSRDNQSMMTVRDTSKNDSLITEDESFELPVVQKLPPPIGRFLTSTQYSNITPNCTAQTKKQESSAPKVMPFPKSTSCSNRKASTSSSAKAAALSRENSADGGKEKERMAKALEEKRLKKMERERIKKLFQEKLKQVEQECHMLKKAFEMLHEDD